MSDEYVTCGCGTKVKKVVRYEMEIHDRNGNYVKDAEFTPKAGLMLHALNCSEADKLL